MTRRKRVPLQLKGSDEQYFRTREIQTKPEPEPETPVIETDTPPVAVETAPEPVVSPPKPRKKPGPRKAVTKPEEPALEEAEIVSRIVHLGKPLSKRVQDLAEDLGVSVDDLLYAARKKAMARFKAQIGGKSKPSIPEPVKGGETLRIALKISGEEMARLKGWYDPLDIGLATKVISPLLGEALRIEVKAMCDASN